MDRLLDDPTLDPHTQAAEFLNEEAGFTDAGTVLDGARQIFLERVAEQADLVGRLRDYVWDNARLKSTVVDGQEEAGVKFKDYFD